MTISIMILFITKHKDIQYNNTQDNYNQLSNSQHNDQISLKALSIMALDKMTIGITTMSIMTLSDTVSPEDCIIFSCIFELISHSLFIN